MKTEILAATGAMAMLVLSQTAQAGPILVSDAYQGFNNGLPQMRAAGTGTDWQYSTGGIVYASNWQEATTQGNLLSDYGDGYSGTPSAGPTVCAVNYDPSLPSPLCANVGNLDIGSLGLDHPAYSGTNFDQFVAGGPNGVLANMDAGTPSDPVPEPGTLSLLGIGGLALLRRLRKAR